MASLPSHAFTLTGGCFCKAIRYTIEVPAAESRPNLPRPSEEIPLGPQASKETMTRCPIISFDHCESCRRIAGGLFECWLTGPTSWIQFSLLSRSSIDKPSSTAERTVPDTKKVAIGEKTILEYTFLSTFSSSEGVSRDFCGRCGTHLSWFKSHGGLEDNQEIVMDIAVGTLDKQCLEMEGLRPNSQVLLGEGIDWVRKMIAEGEKVL